MSDAINSLTPSEKDLLADQIMAALNRERRRANARSVDYDLARHISLYTAAGKLGLAVKQ